MALVLSGHAAWRIMLVGRWRTTAFLVYIREQVQALCKGVSDRMLENPDFYHVPDIDHLDAATQRGPTATMEAAVTNGNTPNRSGMLPFTFLG
jgi:hypothetical protein